jgi:hypothetical protein
MYLKLTTQATYSTMCFYLFYAPPMFALQVYRALLSIDFGIDQG